MFIISLTTNNFVSATFDPFGFTVMHFKTSVFIQRCDSVNDLYPILPSPLSSLTATTCVVVSLPIVVLDISIPLFWSFHILTNLYLTLLINFPPIILVNEGSTIVYLFVFYY